MSKEATALANEKFAQAINAALREYRGESYVQPPMEDVNSGSCHLVLNRQQVIQAVVAMVIQLNLTSGSAGDLNLYRLLQAYLLDTDKRCRLNAVVNF